MLIPFDTDVPQPDWGTLENRSIGGFEVRDFLGADSQSAVFRAESSDIDNADAVIKFYRVDQEGIAAAQAEIWLEAKSLDHPNLIRLMGAGRTTLGDHKLVYVAVEPADESLASALIQRRLEPAEAAEILTSAKSALEYLHSHGFIHSCFSPEQIFAVGDAIKLSTEGIRKAATTQHLVTGKPKYLAPESRDVNTTRAADVWCLGATLLEATTGQNVASGKWSAQAAPEQLRTTIHRCLIADAGLRTSLAEIVREPIAPAVTAPPATPLPQTGRPEPPKILYPLKPERTGLPFAAYAIAAVVLIAILIWLFRPSNPPKPQEQAKAVPASQPKTLAPGTDVPKTANPELPRANEPSQEMQKPSPSKPMAEAAHPVRQPTKQSPVAETPKPTPKADAGTRVNGNVWRVVVYTYQKESDAKDRADAINRAHPQLNAVSFSPNGEPPFLVTVGGTMSRTDARQVRQEAIRLGLPPDSYAQNFQN